MQLHLNPKLTFLLQGKTLPLRHEIARHNIIDICSNVYHSLHPCNVLPL